MQIPNYQLRRKLALIVMIAFTAMLGLIFLTAFQNKIPLETFSLAPVVVNFLGLVFGLYFLFKGEKYFTWAGLGFLIFPLAGALTAYNNGIMPFAFAAINSFIVVVFFPQRFSVWLSYGLNLSWWFAFEQSGYSDQADYVAKMIIASMAIVLPLHTLINSQSWSSLVRYKASRELLLSIACLFLMFSIYDGHKDFLARLPGYLAVAVFGIFYYLTRNLKELLTNKTNYRLLDMAFFFAAALNLIGTLINGFQSSLLLPALILGFYLTLPLMAATILVAFYFLISIIYLDGMTIDPQIINPFMMRYALLTLLFWGLVMIAVRGLQGQSKKTIDAINLSICSRVGIFAVLGLAGGLLLIVGNPELREILQHSDLGREQISLLSLNFVIWVFFIWLGNAFLINGLKLAYAKDELEVALHQAEAAKESLAQKNNQQAQMFSIIGHELRTPAAATKMMYEQLHMHSQAPYGKYLVDYNQQLLDILDDISLVVQPDRIKETKTVKTELGSIVESAVSTLDNLASIAEIDLDVRCHESTTQRVSINASALRQTIINLVKNAILHSEGSRIGVNLSTQVLADRVIGTLIVEDNGKGIPADKREKLFEAFERGETRSGGTGLGLFIIKNLTELLNGEVEYIDQANTPGACFKVTFNVPLADKKQGKDHGEAQGVTESVLRGMRVLFVEDNITISMVSELMLNKVGAVVTMAENGQDALEKFQLDQFDLVITDAMMPVMDGNELSKQLRNKGYDGPIIAITAAVLGKEIEQLVGSGANKVLSKPLQINVLEQAVGLLRPMQA